jgi:regulator of sigma D
VAFWSRTARIRHDNEGKSQKEQEKVGRRLAPRFLLSQKLFEKVFQVAESDQLNSVGHEPDVPDQSTAPTLKGSH